ncbi:DNA polymerase IV [Megalodesulfovibrio gigas]|uniref:DNA polymerase IV n=1 Tax=Megalodesulfovibrio gigas (strain ATCC 19364 / DSM 1382 / NCIMB 9332 / VKM B-1759) TaxID=1121448 RepID=T2G9B9_MEGG1|nr:DNA polymerase IV [Megalodesulfovibrio gigas]AGW13180.1 putative DNA-directed DNA polymerase [Megalodesulfovibrio gigas DSM 1382 = ATCC 19364]
MAAPSCPAGQRWILHLDMDAFFASVEVLDNPALAGKPVIVGGGERGVVSAASYPARAFGVRSGMPSAQARKLCPHGIFLHGSHSRYGEVSRLAMAALAQFSPIMEQASVDEAYLDMTGMEPFLGPPEAMGRAVKDAVRRATGGLACSVGLAPVKFLAKIASDWNKPDGLFVLHPTMVDDFLIALPVGKIPGVGGKSEARLRQLGIRTVGDLRRLSPAFFVREFGKWGQALWDRAHGIDPRGLTSHWDAKSEGAEVTLDHDTADRELLARHLYQQCHRVGRRLRKDGRTARTITLKLKDRDFKSITRSRTVELPVASTDGLFEVAKSLLDKEKLSRPLRLIGVSASGFFALPRQLPLFDDAEARREERRQTLDKTLDDIEARFGRGAVQRGRAVGTHDRESIQKSRRENPGGLEKDCSEE